MSLMSRATLIDLLVNSHVDRFTRGFCGGLVLALMLSLTTTRADAQEQASSAAVDEVTVTGSRIADGFGTPSPLTVITREDIFDTKAVTLEDFIRRVPELDNNGGGVTSNFNPNGNNNAATVSLRNMGYRRTLVLLNGQRMVPTPWGGTTASVELSAIPAAMIERIDVLKDGASSIYGADAIGGVINVITRKTFDGFQFDGSVGAAGEGDDFTYTSQGTFGTTFDRGHIITSVGVVSADGTFGRDRDWAVNQFLGTSAEGLGPNLPSSFGLVTDLPGVGQVIFYGSGPSEYAVVRPVGGEPRDVLAEMGIQPPSGSFFLPGSGYHTNLGAKNTLVSGNRVKNVAADVSFELTPGLSVVANGFYTDKEGTAVIIDDIVASFLGPITHPGFRIPANLESYTVDPVTGARTITTLGPNPQNPFGVDLTALYHISTGARLNTNVFKTYRMQAGLAGVLGERFTWNAGQVYGNSSGTTHYTNNINYDHLAKLTGQQPCGGDVLIGCSVANLFGVGTLTPEQLDYLTVDRASTTAYRQQFTYVDFSGPIAKLPAGNLSVAVGAEYREETLQNDPSAFDINFMTRFPAAATHGSYEVKSVYGEARIPIVTDSAFAKSITLNGSVRYDDYDSFGGASTWKIGAEFALNDSIRLRGATSTGFRAPSLGELFGGRVPRATPAFDPCSTDNGEFAGSPQCVADLTAAGADPATFTNPLTGFLYVTGGGNPNLDPETSRYHGVGAVFTPSAVPSLSASIDWYRIALDEAMSSLSAQSILTACYGPSGTRCDQVTRGAGGVISDVQTFLINLGRETTSGLDFSLAYRFRGADIRLPFLGDLAVESQVVHLLSHEVTGASGAARERTGTFSFSNNDMEPEWRGNIALGVSPGERWNFRWNARYVGPVINVDNPVPGPGNQAGSVMYHDFSGGFRQGGFLVNVGVNNLFDKEPPFLADFTINTLATGGYDLVGRYFYSKLSYAW